MLPICAKSDVFAAFKQFKVFAENQTERKIKTLRDDKGGEYMSNAMLEFTNSCGIERQHTVRARPQQNGVAERANRVLSERITAMLKESGLAMAFWGEAFQRSFMSGIGVPQLPWTMPHPMSYGMDANRMFHICESGVALLMCMCRRTSVQLCALIMRSASSSDTQMATRGGSSTIPPHSAQ